MSGKNVPGVIGTGLHQFAGILSVTDISGNNIATFSSNSVKVGNTIGNPQLDMFVPLVTQSAANPIYALTQTAAPVNQSTTLLRVGFGTTGSFVISSAADGIPGAAVRNLLLATRAGTDWSSLILGDFGDTTSYEFRGSGTIKALGPVAGNLVDMTPDQASFTANYSGFGSVTTGSATWARTGNVALLLLAAVSGTSNSTSFSLTNLPASISPTGAYVTAVPSGAFRDNGVNVSSTTNSVMAQVAGGGVINFLNSGGWTAAGSKGLVQGLLITMMLQ